MLKKGVITQSIVVVGVLLIGGIIASSFMTGCTTTTTGETVGDEIDAAQKAKEDSLAREKYKREFLIAFSTGNEHHKNKNYVDAIKPLLKAAKMDTAKEYPAIYTKLADSFLKLDKPDSALAVYQEGIEKYPENAFFYRRSGWLLTAKQQIPEAIEAYYQAIEFDGEEISDYKNLGPLLLSENRNDDALVIYEKVTELDPNDAEAQQVYASLLAETGDVMAVIDAREKALASKPEDVTLMFDLGKMYFTEQMYPEAVEKFDMLLAISPEDVDALEYKGSALQNDYKYNEAIKSYEKVLALKPDNARVMCEMATCYMELGNLRKAMSVAQNAIRTDSNFGLGYIVKGDIYARSADDCIGKREKRIAVFDDKLVYEKAYRQYQRAAQDLQFSDMAKRKMNYIKPEIPTKEDLFMHPDQKEPNLDCYAWLP